MNALHLMILVGYALGMAAGQLIFKAASQNITGLHGFGAIKAIAFNSWFISGVFLYGLLTFLWIWILSHIPLSKAYPFVALSFIFAPLGALIFFGEKLSGKYFLGIGLLMAGLIIIAIEGGVSE